MTELESYSEPVATIDVGIGTNRRAVDLASLMGLAQRIARVNEFVPTAFRGRPEAILAALLTGAELGLGPMQSLRSIHVIEGRPALSAEVMRALVLANGHEIVVDESTDQKCTVRGRRRDTDQWSNPITWTIDQARRAKLAGRQNWTNYPRQMLLARATGELCRTFFADVIGGLEAIEDLDSEGPAVNGPKPKTRTRKALDTPHEIPAPEPQADEPKPAEGHTAPDPEPAEPATPPPTARKRTPRKPSPPTAPATEGDEERAAPETNTITVSGAALNPDDHARRKLHALIADVFPDDTPEDRDRIRHALCILVSRLRPDGPVASSTQLDDSERAVLTARLNEIRTGQLVIALTEHTIELAAGPWRYYVRLDPPSVEVLDSRAFDQ